MFLSKARSDGLNRLVNAVIAEEHEELRGGFIRGANIVVTHMETPSARIAHQIACPALD
jgi:hypothetical protein